MAVLNSRVRTTIHQALHRAYCDERVSIAWTRAEVDSAVAAVDSFMDTTGEAAINNAFPLSFRQQSTISDRALLLIGVVIARRLVQSPGAISILRTVLNNIG